MASTSTSSPINSMASSSTSSPIILKSSDGQTFELEEAAARMSVTIKNMIEDDCAGDEIPLPNVDSATLTKVAEYCKHHSAAAPGGDESTKEFDERFIADLKGNRDALFDLILASNYLAIKELMELACQEVADMIKDKSPEEVREIFNIENDFTAEEEEEVRKENAWVYQNIN